VLPSRRSEGPIVDKKQIIHLVIGLRAIGIDPDPALRRIGWSCDAILACEEPFRRSFFYDFWQSLTETVGPGIGLRLAEQARPKMFPVLGDVIANSASLGDALIRGVRFTRVAHSHIELSVSIEGDRAMLVHAPLERALLHREAVELLSGIIATFARRLARSHHAPEEVRFAHAAPADTARYEAFFGAPVRFGQPHDALVFHTALLLEPVVGANTSVVAAAEREAIVILEDQPKTENFTAHVRALIDLELKVGNASVEQIAGKLGMHRKTLTRHLKANGTTFQRLLAELRYERAERWLRKPGMSVADVAVRLGYADASAFNKAFKRWAGSGPQSYRQKHGK
jgi:AraC-like DNA-binding protein